MCENSSYLKSIIKNYKNMNSKDLLVLYLDYFNLQREKSFPLARRLWLFCYDNGLDVPEEVEKVFISKLRGDDLVFCQAGINSVADEYRKMNRDYPLYIYVTKRINDGLTIEKALLEWSIKYNENYPGLHSRYHRTRKEVLKFLEVGEVDSDNGE